MHEEYGRVSINFGRVAEFRHNEAFSFQIATDTQEETDRYSQTVGKQILFYQQAGSMFESYLRQRGQTRSAAV